MREFSVAEQRYQAVLAVISETGVPAKAPMNVMLNGPPVGPATETLPARAGIVFRLARTVDAVVVTTPTRCVDFFVCGASASSC